MVAIPVRWYSDVGAGAFTRRFRAGVGSATTRTLTASPAALAILSQVSGRYLTPTQRLTLGDVLAEHQSLPAQAAPNSGPLAMTDTLGVVLGVAQFVLSAGGDWLAMHIPEWGAPTPDILAIPAKGGAWRVEVKATAPLGFAHAHGAKVDLCAQMYGRRTAARAQLAARRLPMFTGAPLISAAQGTTIDPLYARGGAAVVVQGISDAAIASRIDLVHGGVFGCPSGSTRCGDVCLRGRSTPAVGVLVGEPGPNAGGGQAPPMGWRRILMATLGGTHAAWAGAVGVADAALSGFIDGLAELGGADILDDEQNLAVALFGGVLETTRGTTTRRQRQIAVDRFVTFSRAWPGRAPLRHWLEAEAAYGVTDAGVRSTRRLVDVARAGPSLETGEWRTVIDNTPVAVVWAGSTIRIIPTEDSWHRVLVDGPALMTQLERATQEALSALDQRDVPFESADVSATFGPDDTRTWTVGRAAVGPLQAWASRDGRAEILLTS